MLHPVSWLVLWAVLAIALNKLPLVALSACALVLLACGERYAGERYRRLIWRSRWLLLSVALLFLFFTPGIYLADPFGYLGITNEGLHQALTQLGVLVAMLASLALLHEYLGTRGLLAGLYVLMRPLGHFVDRRSTIIKLMLVLDFVERPPAGGWRAWLQPELDDGGQRGAEVLVLQVLPLSTRDHALLASSVISLIVMAM